MDIQKEFDSIQELERKLCFLLQNAGRKKSCARFAQRMANRFLARYTTDFRIPSAYLHLSVLYPEFSRLSNRQKTKVGGFRGFVKKELGEILSPEKEFSELMLHMASFGHGMRRPRYIREFLTYGRLAQQTLLAELVVKTANAKLR